MDTPKTALFPAWPVLVVDDEPEAAHSTRMALSVGGISHALECHHPREVMDLIAKERVGLVLLDLSMPELPGEEILAAIAKEYPDVPVIIITGMNDVPTAVRCMRNGAFDYMVKPVERSRLVSGAMRAVELRNLRLENLRLRDHMFHGQVEHPEAFQEIVSGNRQMQAVFQYVETVATSAQPVLVTGATGTGKELIARAIHQLSGRRGPFVGINVAGLDDTLFSDALFGHVTGAFTGGEKPRGGFVEKAAAGTLFLDEIGDLKEMSQVKILRLLQEREYYPLGSDVARRSDARIIVSTHKDLLELQTAGQFRKDLYYRLRFHHVQLPSLSERRDDIPLLLDFFLEKAAKALGKKKPGFPKELVSLLLTYLFPGNVRELEAMVFDALSRHQSHLLSMEAFERHIAQHSPVSAGKGAAAPTPGANLFATLEVLPGLDDTRELLIQDAMRRAQGNQSLAARMLGITQQALSKWLKTHQAAPAQ